MKYQWRDGFRPQAVTAEQAYQEMERLRTQGPLTATKLFEAARPAKAPLHGEFEWDGTEAIKQLGLMRARGLLRSVEVFNEKTPAEPARHVYVHVPDPSPKAPEGYYEPLAVVAAAPDAFARAVNELERKFRSAESALDELKAAAQQSAAPDRLAAIAMATQAFAAARQALAAIAA